MLYSYRHPDLVSKDLARSKLTVHECAVLVERRRVVREIPTSAAVEQNGDEVWALWDSVTGAGELTSE
jgi:hypothetical protein